MDRPGSPRTLLLTGLVAGGLLLAAGCGVRSVPATTGAPTVASNSAAGTTASAAASAPASTVASSATASATTSSTATGTTAATSGQAMPKTGFGMTGPLAVAVVVFGAGLSMVSWRRLRAAQR